MRRALIERGPDVRRAILLAIVAGVPLVFLRVTNDWFNVPKFGLLVAGTVAAACLRIAEISQGASWQGLRRLWVPAVAVVGPLLVAWIFAPYRYFSILGTYSRYQGLIPYLILALLGLLIADAFVDRPVLLAWGLATAGGVAGVYAVVQLLGMDPFEWPIQGGEAEGVVATLGNPNFAGAFFGMLLPIVLVLWLVDVKHRTLLAWVGALVVVGCLGSLSLGGWAAGAAGLAVTGGFVLAPRWPLARVAGLVLAGGLLVGSIGLAVVGNAFPELEAIPGTARLRGGWWVAAARMGVEHPVVGRGPNSFSIEGVQYRTARDAATNNYLYPDDPHSVALSLFDAAGILGLVGFVVVLAWVVWRGLSLADGDLVQAGFFGAACAYFVQSFVSIDELALRVAFWAALGGLVATPLIGKRKKQAREKSTAKPPARRRGRPSEPLIRKPVVVLLALVTAAAVVWSGAFVWTDARVLHAKNLFRDGRPQAGIEEFWGALAFREEYAYRRNLGLFSGQAAIEDGDEALLATMRKAFGYLDAIPDVLAMTIEGRLLSDFAENDPSVRSEAVRVMQRAARLDERNPLIRTEIALLQIALDQPREAVAVLSHMTDLVGERYPELWGALALAHVRAGNEGDARRLIGVALTLDPNEASARKAQDELSGSEGTG